MKQLYSGLLFFSVAIFATACSVTGNKAIDNKEAVIADKILTASGHSQYDQNASLSAKQRRLAAEQSAKISAYRQLAAKLYQERLPGGLTVAGQVVKNEAYRLYFDTFLREAKVVAWLPLGNSLQTTMALTVTDRFYRCIAGDMTYLGQCLQEDNKIPFTRLGYNTAEVKPVNLACSSADCSGQFYISGFSQGKNKMDSALLNAGLYDGEWLVNTSSRLFINYILLNAIPNL